MTLQKTLLLAAVAFVLLVFAFFAFSARHREKAASAMLSPVFWQHMVSPGELSQAHASLENNCASCHTPVKGVEASKCIVCHAPHFTRTFKAAHRVISNIADELPVPPTWIMPSSRASACDKWKNPPGASVPGQCRSKTGWNKPTASLFREQSFNEMSGGSAAPPATRRKIDI